jgi:hypothetical protein
MFNVPMVDVLMVLMGSVVVVGRVTMVMNQWTSHSGPTQQQERDSHQGTAGQRADSLYW